MECVSAYKNAFIYVRQRFQEFNGLSTCSFDLACYLGGGGGGGVGVGGCGCLADPGAIYIIYVWL